MAKKKPRPGDATVDEYLDAADDLLGGLEAAAAVSKAEVAPLRLGLAVFAREAGRKALAGMKTKQVGRARILVPGGKNEKKAIAASERVRDRFSRFKVNWLDKGEVNRLISSGFTKADQRKFFRHSNRLARQSRIFFERLGELEPSLQEEIDATLRQITDARNDLTKVEFRSWTTVQENLLRNINGQASRQATANAVQTFDLDRNLFNLAMLEHPKGVARELLANSSERMAARVTRTASELPKKALVFVGAGPDAVSKMTPDSRAARVMWRVFSADQLDKRFAALNAGRQSSSSWRGLGQAHNTPEWYIPIPPEVEDDVRRSMRKRRQDFLTRIQIKE